MFAEMRLAATLQAVTRGAGALPAREVLTMATREGASRPRRSKRTRLDCAGKRADLIIVERDRPHLATGPDPFSTLVYAARPTDVRTTIVDGEILVDDFQLVREDVREIVADARHQAEALAARAF